MRLLILVLLLALLGLGWRANLAGSVGTWWQQRGADARKTAELEQDLVTRLQQTRQQMRVGDIQPDARLQQWLGQRMEHETQDMNALIHDAQNVFPEYQQMAALQTWRATEKELATNLQTWPEIGGESYSHLALTVRPSWGGLGWHGCLVVGQRLPAFTPEALNASRQSLFYSECTLCGRKQACQIPRHTRSLSLECGGCRRMYAMVASGSNGQYRYVNEFLEGYEPPAMYPENQPRLAELMTIWRAVSAGCQYTQDTGTDDNDAWQTARETQALGRGDCEDSAILLADWLLARGFEARVALGRYAERGGHAWVIVRLEGEEYLLESTEGTTGARKAPLLSEVGSRYVPEILFDRDAFYTRIQPLALWNGDFWTDKTWLRVVPGAARQ
ncbi:transglutaminase superfamily protein [Roseimicrobium gellanilyticum]|uniref:Transglutaminase superfamily protein n=1 Tax=Roseimicrobium gellanilyticum TaxID=748857 RepID=A0A366HSZ9_9BACT|nr:transglutaminase family protein [Roseimicrobium gellanilyticum]RBP47411.1 transglutaminase superfamily protein [Roseimicrobium gellanilyticum]